MPLFKDNFNFLAVVVNPEQDCSLVEMPDYDFVGYDVLEKYAVINIAAMWRHRTIGGRLPK